MVRWVYHKNLASAPVERHRTRKPVTRRRGGGISRRGQTEYVAVRVVEKQIVNCVENGSLAEVAVGNRLSARRRDNGRRRPKTSSGGDGSCIGYFENLPRRIAARIREIQVLCCATAEDRILRRIRTHGIVGFGAVIVKIDGFEICPCLVRAKDASEQRIGDVNLAVRPDYHAFKVATPRAERAG